MSDRAGDVNRRFRPVRIDGEAVTRPAPPNAGFIHAALRHLRDAGLPGVPEPLGVIDGIETLSYIEGESGGDGWYHQHADDGLASVARYLRRMHDASVGFVATDDEVLCHGDPGPWNFVWRDSEAVGLIDWDYAHPGPRLDDVAYALQWFAPFRSDELALEWHHFPEVPDRWHRVEVFLDAYGGLPAMSRADVVEAVVAVMEHTRARVAAFAAEGREPQRTWVADGELDRLSAELEWVRRQVET